MRNTIKISVILLVLLTAGSFSLSAQRGMRGAREDSTRMGMHRMGRMHMPPGTYGQDSIMSGRMRRGPGSMGMPIMPPSMCPMWGMHRPFSHGGWPGMGMWTPAPWGRMHPGMFGEYGFAQGPGMRMLERVPNLTDKQKKEISDLRQKQKDEMEKFRSDMQKQMQNMRDSHRKEIMNVLTEDQKKWIEENRSKATMPPDPSEAPESHEAPDAPIM